MLVFVWVAMFVSPCEIPGAASFEIAVAVVVEYVLDLVCLLVGFGVGSFVGLVLV